ncbi:MAG TPA: nuclear transport factor 2 family protein [Rhodanobacteraceae bacterium]|nr:nuclear transport factor 2 family protein [Rhodanobacteraceae bacterium]
MQMRTVGSMLALALCTSAVAVRAAPAAPELQGEIVSITQSLLDAIGAGDKGVWQRTLADDAVIVDEFGRVQRKQEAVDSLRPLPPGFSGSIEVRDPHVQVYGDTAVLQAEGYERESVFGQKFVVRYLMLCTYVKQDGAWKLAGYQDVTLPTPPPKLAVPGLTLHDYAGTWRYGPDRAWTFSVKDGVLGYVTKPGRPVNTLDPIAKDVFMGSDDEKNLLIFRRDAAGRVTGLIERRKFNDLHFQRDLPPDANR